MASKPEDITKGYTVLSGIPVKTSIPDVKVRPMKKVKNGMTNAKRQVARNKWRLNNKRAAIKELKELLDKKNKKTIKS